MDETLKKKKMNL